ncbi:MAG TPA: phosphohydrolase [Mycobacterium sp.]|nr:phosphohydrolase [Mycobacterium sp.]
MLFLACALHDVGLTDAGNGSQRFEVDGADLAASFMTDRGFAAEAVDTVWQAIALHTSPGIVERRGAVCALSRGGIVIDAEAQLIHAAYPRLSAVRELYGAISDQVAARPEKGPFTSLPWHVAQPRNANGLNHFEDQMIATSRWGS